MFLLQHTDINITEGAIFSFIAIVIVFAILIFIVLSVTLMEKFKIKDKKEEVKPQLAVAPSKKFTMEDIKDEDMMVAALIATAEFVEETKEKDARLVSIKQIG